MMTPQERNEFDTLKTLVDTLLRAENVSFIENIKRRMDLAGLVRTEIGNASINDLGDVDITSVSNGQVLKYTTSGTDRWINGTDNV